MIAEAPDATEDQTGQAFSGLGHTLLRQALTHTSIPSDQVYLTYLSKWRPPGQRSLTVQELELMQGLLAAEMALVQPQHVIILGDVMVRVMDRLADSLMVTGPSDSQAKTSRAAGGVFKLYNIDFKHKNEKSVALALQKAEIMVKDSLVKKRVWQSLLAFNRVLPTS